MAHTLEVIVAKCVITFNVMFGANQGYFEVTYRFQNNSQRPAVIFNMLNRPGEHPAMVDPSRVAIWPAGKYLEISKMAYPAPPLKSVESLYIPMGSVVVPGARFAETVRVPLPFRLWHPYFDPNNLDREDLAGLEGIWFRLGFFLADPGYIKTAQVTPLSDRDVVKIAAYNPDDQEIAEFTLPVDDLAGMIARP